MKLLNFSTDEKNSFKCSISDLLIPEWCRDIKFGTNLDFHSKKMRFFASSPIHPTHAFDYDFETHEHQIIHIDEVNK